MGMGPHNHESRLSGAPRLSNHGETAATQGTGGFPGPAIWRKHHTAEKLTHEGFMFDARVTVIFYVMSCVFVYVMARLRVVIKKFALAEIFGIIIMDLFLLFGPTLPFWDWRVADSSLSQGLSGLVLASPVVYFSFPSLHRTLFWLEWRSLFLWDRRHCSVRETG